MLSCLCALGNWICGMLCGVFMLGKYISGGMLCSL